MKKHQPAHQTCSNTLTDSISIEQLRSIWNDKNQIYQDEELYQIRDWLNVIAEIIWDIIEEKEQSGTLHDFMEKMR